MFKQCTKCGETKALEFFYRRKDGPQGRNYWCKPCCTVSTRETYNSNKQYYRAISRNYYHTKNKVCGVYMLETTIGYYIGESFSIVDRNYNHKAGSSDLELKKGEYIGYKVLEEVQPDKELLKQREGYWIKKLKPNLNVRPSNHRNSKYY